MLTIDSGDVLWDSVSRRPIEQLKTSSEKQAEIRRVFFSSVIRQLVGL
jgi:hypothetical protein